MKMKVIMSRAAMTLLSGLLVTVLTSISEGLALQRATQDNSVVPPTFADLATTDRFEGKSAPVKIVTRQARTYRTMLRDSIKDGPNFAGHYAIGQWGCGAGCVQFAIIDAKTGNVYFPPFFVSVVAGPEEKMDEIPEPLQFKPDSKLLIVTGARNEKGGGVYYYKWDNKQLSLISSTPLPKK